ncbi:hypothetical protein AaE_013173, partial [Aphanomyces astaci]
DNPVLLVGHSYGATTALELYQLLCVDFFGIGSNYKWVKSIVSISGTLSGTTMGMYHHAIRDDDGSMFGSTLGNPSPYGSISYLIACGFATLHKLQQHVPWLSNLYDLRMPQWAHASSSSWRTLYDPAHKPLNTDDNGYDKDDWQHSDGVVNSYSMIRPRLSFAPPPPVEEPPEEGTPAVMVRVPSHVSIDMGVPDELNAVMISTGQWHVYRVNKNHLCGTRGDGDARELYTRLFRLLNQISGTSPCDTILPLPPTQLELGFLTT